MLRSNLFIVFFSLFLLLLSGCQKTLPVEQSTTTIMLTPIPTAKEKVLVPTGYTTCFIVKETIYQHNWIPAHGVCQYEKINGQVIWIDGYWACTQYEKTGSGVCHHWLWQPAHWAQPPTIY